MEAKAMEMKDEKFSAWRRFVVKEHFATRLHYDLRLELDGVLKSWAVPKGPSLDPAISRLAVRVDDESLSGFKFEGRFPEGMPGAGPVTIWDIGEYRFIGDANGTYSLESGRVTVEFRGVYWLKGAFRLQSIRGELKNWIFSKVPDDHAHPGWRLKQNLTWEQAQIYGLPTQLSRRALEGKGQLKIEWESETSRAQPGAPAFYRSQTVLGSLSG